MSIVGRLVNGTKLTVGLVGPLLGRLLRGTTGAEPVTASVSTPSDSTCNVRSLIHQSQPGEDWTGFGPQTQCVCGSTLFIALVEFDDDGCVGSYFTDGVCAACNAAVTLITEIDVRS